VAVILPTTQMAQTDVDELVPLLMSAVKSVQEPRRPVAAGAARLCQTYLSHQAEDKVQRLVDFEHLGRR
jgi:hypothetical protein